MVKRKKRSTNKTDESSGLTKNQLAIILALITAGGIFFGGSTYNSMWDERAIIELSFGIKDGYPLNELQHDGKNYYIDIIGINRGISQTDPLVTIVAENAKVSFNSEIWQIRQQNNILFRPSEEFGTYRLYVQPNEDVDSFSVTLYKPTISIPHEVYSLIPTTLVFQFDGEKYVLTKSY